MSEVVKNLNNWLGIRHKVSLIGRHESNGCEGSGKQFLRHLKTLVYDERIVNKWSHDTVLPLINFSLCSFPTSETGGYTPFQLKYGTLDTNYFKLPQDAPAQMSHQLIKDLDRNLQTVRDLSHSFQKLLVEERQKNDNKVPAVYEEGDLVFWNPKEHSKSVLESKLAPPYLGPFVVLSQEKNDVTVRHINLNTTHIFHVGRLKPFFGSREEGQQIAKIDQNQFHVELITSYTGNPFIRTSMLFMVKFEFETSTIAVRYSNDIAATVQFQAFVLSRNELFPLRFQAAEVSHEIAKINKLTISSVSPGQIAYVSLRFYDGRTSGYYDSLNLPDPLKEYVVPFTYLHFVGKSQRRILAINPLFQLHHTLTTYDVFSYGSQLLFNELTMVLVTPSMRSTHPKIWQPAGEGVV
jgi:hypothetical protein